MGEAKRRKAADPGYGKPKLGLVMSNPMEIEGRSLSAKSSSLDPQELRFALLFWDRLVWPTSSSIRFMGGPDEQFLESAEVLTRPNYTYPGDVAQGIAKSHIQAFVDLDTQEPGLWSLAQGENSLLLKDQLLKQGEGGAIELIRAIPVPDKDVPIQDILEFKRNRYDELLALRSEIDSLVATVNKAADKDAEIARQAKRIDAACADVIKAGKERQFPLRLTNFKACVELRPFATLAGGLAAYAATAASLSASAAVLAGLAGAAAATAPALKLSADFGWKGLSARENPYRYVYSFHREVF